MKELAGMLEEELSDAVEVKNPKSLHRYIYLLTSNYVEQNIHDRQYNQLSSSIKEMLATMIYYETPIQSFSPAAVLILILPEMYRLQSHSKAHLFDF